MPRALVILLTVLFAVPALAQPARPARPLENIKVLKGWTSAEVRDEMQRMSDALGVKCAHCHVQGNFASDEKRAKHTGRRMLELTMALNAEYFAEPPAGRRRVEAGAGHLLHLPSGRGHAEADGGPGRPCAMIDF